MKPRSRPGKVITDGRAAREIQAKAKPLSENQLDHIKNEEPFNPHQTKAGKGGQRAHWDTDYAEGCQFGAENMPCRENDGISQDGVRKLPKKGH